MVIKAKILIQHLWQKKKGWDDEIYPKYQKIWLNWERDLTNLQQVRAPRWNRYTPTAETIELHGFADASKLAYGACLYLRIIQNGVVSVTLMTAKSKIAPLKPLSIPRLELSAAH